MCAWALAAANSVAAEPVAAEPIDALILGPGCLGDTTTNLNEFLGLDDPLHDAGAPLKLEYSMNSLREASRFILPSASSGGRFVDATQIVAFSEATAHEQKERWTQEVPVIVTPEGIYFQYPLDEKAPWLMRMLEERTRTQPDSRRRLTTGRLSEVTRGTTSAWVLDVPSLTPTEGDHDDTGLAPIGVARVPLPDGAVVYGIGRSIGDPAKVRRALDDQRAGKWLFHLGPGGLSPGQSEGASELDCGEVLEALRPDAALPHSGDLASGAAALVASRQTVPWVMTNLRPVEERPDLSTYRLLRRGDTVVVVLGLLSPQTLSTLDAAKRGAWKYVPTAAAVAAALREVRVRLGRPADVVIALTNASPSSLEEAVAGLEGVHVVIGKGQTPGGQVLRSVTAEHSVVPRSPLALWFHGRAALGHLSVARPSSEALRVEFVDERIEDDMAAQAPAEPAALKDFKDELIAASKVVFPDPDAFLRAHEELAPLLWGPRVVNGMSVDVNPPSAPPQLVDPVWLTFVANTVQRSLDVDVTLVRNRPRHSQILGPVVRAIAQAWLMDQDELRVVDVRGAALLGVVPLLTRFGPDAEPADLVMASGLVPGSGRVAGRAIDPRATYRVAVGASVFDLPAFAEALSSSTPASGVTPSSVQTIVMQRLESAIDAAGGFLPGQEQALLADVLPQGAEKVARWSVAVDELSGSGIAFRNSDGIANYAITRETRATNPNLFQGGLRVSGATLFDGPSIAWETRLRVEYDGVLLDIPEVPVNVLLNEQRDDAVLSTELRLNRVRLGVADDGFEIVPYLQGNLDSELTATPDKTRPDAWFPHQALVRESLGLVAFPGPVVREVRVGLLAQHDASEAVDALIDGGSGVVAHDVGFVVGYKASVPLWQQLTFQSELDARYFVPDGDDRPVDLALRAQAIERLVWPLTDTLSMFVFVDVFVLQGKTEANAALAYNAITGLGLNFSNVWR
jgi:hypothetical protein